MFGLRDILRSPEDSLSGSTDVGDDVALMEGDDVPVPETEEEDEETDEQGESGETEETEEEEEQIEDSKAILPHERPNITDLKAAFPDLLKKFPALREVIYREKRYDEEFGDIESAVKAKEDSESFQNLHTDIFQGNGTKFFESIKTESPEALARFATKILPTLFKVDENAHWAAANPLIALVTRSFLQAGKDNEDVKKAADLFAKFMFGDNAQGVLDGKITFTTQESTKQEDPEVTAFRAERKQAFLTDVAKQAENGLRAMVLEKNKSGKLILDPDDEFSPYLKTTIVKNIMDEISRQIKVDATHMRYASSLLKKAEDAKFPSEAKDSIINAYLSRARQLVKKVRLQVVSEVRGDRVSASSEKTKRVVERSRQPEAGGGGRVSKAKGFTPGQKVDYKKYSDEDIINDNW